MIELAQQILTGGGLLYCIAGAFFALIIGAFSIDGGVFAFNLPGLVLPMVVVGVISLILCYGYSLDASAQAKELPFE